MYWVCSMVTRGTRGALVCNRLSIASLHVSPLGVRFCRRYPHRRRASSNLQIPRTISWPIGHPASGWITQTFAMDFLRAWCPFRTERWWPLRSDNKMLGYMDSNQEIGIWALADVCIVLCALGPLKHHLGRLGQWFRPGHHVTGKHPGDIFWTCCTIGQETSTHYR
jgi:hypothetical protein